MHERILMQVGQLYLSRRPVRVYLLFSRRDIIAYLSGGRGRARRWITHSLRISLCDQLTQRMVVIKEIAFRDGFEPHHGTPGAAMRCPEATRCRRRNKIAKRNSILFRICASSFFKRLLDRRRGVILKWWYLTHRLYFTRKSDQI